MSDSIYLNVVVKLEDLLRLLRFLNTNKDLATEQDLTAFNNLLKDVLIYSDRTAEELLNKIYGHI